MAFCPSRAASDRSGFTLTEALIALLVLTICLASAFSLTFWLIQANGYSANLTQAISLAQDKMDEFMAGTYAEVVSGSDAVGTFSRTWRITTVSDYKTVEVTVSWRDTRGNLKRFVLNSMVDG